MNCERCEGACCESMTLPAADVHPPSDDARRWLELHATESVGMIGIRELAFECQCTALTPAGRCGIYAERPRVCRDFRPGGFDCLATVRARRTPEQYLAIREDGDPERIHEEAAA